MRPEAKAGAVARALGVRFEQLTALRSTNNVVVWLEPSDVVAKVVPVTGRAADEVRIARRLHATGAPVVPPAPDIGGRVHPVDETHVVSFWRYEPQAGAGEPSSSAVAVALRALHEVLPACTDRLPACTSELSDTLDALDRAAFAPLLRGPDRRALRSALAGGAHLLAEPDRLRSVVHGSPHRNNILAVGGRPRFIDFETVCRGPVEWDLAHLEPAVAAAYPGKVDDVLLAQCRRLVSASTSARCWDALDRGPDMRMHAEHHLAVIRTGGGG